jgi:hypothetical protein
MSATTKSKVTAKKSSPLSISHAAGVIFVAIVIYFVANKGSFSSNTTISSSSSFSSSIRYLSTDSSSSGIEVLSIPSVSLSSTTSDLRAAVLPLYCRSDYASVKGCWPPTRHPWQQQENQSKDNKLDEKQKCARLVVDDFLQDEEVDNLKQMVCGKSGTLVSHTT